MSLTDRLIFVPSKYPEGNWKPPRSLPAPITDVRFSAADGTELNAWYGSPAGARTTILLLHGNAGNLTHRVHLLAVLLALPAAVFLLDYRGYGRSAGQPTETGVYVDAQSAIAWLAMHDTTARASARRPAHGQAQGRARRQATRADPDC